MFRDRIKALLARCTEAIAVVVVVLVFFLGIMTLMNRFFPEGMNLKDLMTGGGRSAGDTRGDGRHIVLETGEEEERELLAAILATVRNTVKSKGADDIAWMPAPQGLALKERDAVQTFSNSWARIRFDREHAIDLGENSLVIIRQFERDRGQRRRQSSLVLVDGELRGLTARGGEEPLQLEVKVPNALVKINQKAGSAKAKEAYLVTVNPDKSSTIAIYQGSAEVSAQGKTVLVKENTATTVLPGQAPQAPTPLPARVTGALPADGTVYRFRQLAPRVRFSWQVPANANRFRFVLARDPAFQSLVSDELLSEPHFTHGNLGEGRYYWRVTSLNGFAEGSPGQVHDFTLAKDLKPPPLQVDFPPATTGEREVILRGRAEAGAKVFVGGQEASAAANGEFSFQLQLQPGINVIVVEALDESGNVTYLSQQVNAKY